MTQPQNAPKAKQTSKVRYDWIAILIVGLIARFSYAMDAKPIAIALTSLVFLAIFMEVSIHIVKKGRDAAASTTGTGAFGPAATAIWKTLWALPIALFVFGFLLDAVTGWNDEGQVYGVIGAVILLVVVIPTYIILGIMRLVQKNRRGNKN